MPHSFTHSGTFKNVFLDILEKEAGTTFLDPAMKAAELSNTASGRAALTTTVMRFAIQQGLAVDGLPTDILEQIATTQLSSVGNMLYLLYIQD